MTTRNRALGVFLTAVAGLALAVNSVEAQSNTKSKLKSYGSNQSKGFANRNSASQFSSGHLSRQLNTASRDRVRAPNLGSYRPPSSNFGSKPFSSISRKPTVSPYLGLNSSLDQASSYYNTVRPQQQQRQVNQQLQHQNMANLHRLNKMAAQGPYSSRGDEESAPTGHAAVFQSLGTYLNTGGYFSGAPIAR